MIKILRIKDVFTDTIRKKLIENCEPLLYPGDNLSDKNNFPGKYPATQTHADLYNHPKFKEALVGELEE